MIERYLKFLLLLFSSAFAQDVLTLAGGRYVTENDVSSWANLAKDLADMRDSQDPLEINQIYNNGKYAKYTDESGNERLRSLASLSVDTFGEMKGDPMYSFFRHAFLELGNKIEGEQLGQFDDRPVGVYADTLVLDLLSLNKTQVVPEAAIVLNVWMYICHQLYDLLRACKEGSAASSSAMRTSLDIAAALWIGVDQGQGGNDSGNLLYNLAEIAGERFGQDEGEAEANRLLLDEFNTLELGINLGTCVQNVNGYQEFRTIVRKMIGHMTIPLVQTLIHFIQEEDSETQKDFVELYTLAIGARVETCVPALYKELLELFVKTSFTTDMRARAIPLLQSVYSCLDVNCVQIGAYRTGEIPACNDFVNVTAISFAGYQPNFDVIHDSRFDRDLLQIGVLVKAGATEAALDYYKFGYNSEEGTYFRSLQQIAQSAKRGVVQPQYDIFAGFYQSDNFADSIIVDALSRHKSFSSASTDQIVQVVLHATANMVMYMAVLERLYTAVTTCEAGNQGSTDSSLLLLDEAAAYFVGSIEGSKAGGRKGGRFLYATSKNLCDFFDTCVDNGNAKVNQEIISALNETKEALSSQSCVRAKEIVETSLEPSLVVPLIQGTLHYAAYSDALESNTADGALGAAFAFVASILPLIDSVDKPSASILASNLDFRIASQPVEDGAAVVFNAVKSGIQKLQIPNIAQQCEFIGIYLPEDVGDVCDGLTPEIPPPPGPRATPQPVVITTSPTVSPTKAPLKLVTEPPVQPTPAPQPVSVASNTVLGFGRYNFETVVDPVANIALDIRDMLLAQSVEAANNTYNEGGNAFSTGDTTNVVSLAAISRTAGAYMAEDPLYNIFRWALQTESVFSDESNTQSNSAFAHVVVQKALAVARDIGLAAETTVAMHVWMEIAHHVIDSIRDCEDGSRNAIVSIDRAVALWIGQDQQEADPTSGYLMYHIAEEVENDFGGSNGEARVNAELISLFNKAQDLTKQCEQTPSTYSALKVVGVDIYRKMTIPLLQKMLYHINRGQANYIELYALAAIPLAVACGETLFERLRDALVTEEAFDATKINQDFFEDMRAFGKCLQITCDDILGGSNPSDDQLRSLIASSCYDKANDVNVNTLAGFAAQNDVVATSRLDMDILLIGILMETNAFEAAEEIYTDGYNSISQDSHRNLRDLATSNNRRLVEDQFPIFRDFFNSDNYAHDIILKAIRGTDMFSAASRDQRAEIVTRCLQTMVLYMSVLELLYTSVDVCEGSGGGVKEWEEAVALFVGSLEGSSRGGAAQGDGTALYALAKEVCTPFGTCEGSGDASVNEFLLDTFADGRDLLADQDCSGASTVIEKEVLSNLLIGMVQATLFYAVENAKLSSNSKAFEISSGYVFSRSILPLVQLANATSAAIITSNFNFDLTVKPVAAGSDAIYTAVVFALPGMKIDCDSIGIYQGKTVCAAAPPLGDGDGDVQENPTPINPDVRPVSVVDSATNLGKGLYITTTYVQDRADIALDIVAIKSALETGSGDLARIIYKDGENSRIYNDNGIKIGQRSIMGFSTTTTLEMNQESTFNIFKFALQNEKGEFLTRNVRLYADTIVDELLRQSNPNSRGLAAEGMVALNIWMYLAHELWQTVENCKKHTITDQDGVHSIDEAVAYWIGDWKNGGGENGHLLYALAEETGKIFQITSNGQSRTNTNILRLFNEAKNEITQNNACSESSNTYIRLRSIVNRLISIMTIPLIQSLIHNLRANDRNRVKLYAQAFAPLTVVCNPDLYSYLQDKLMGLTYNVIEIEDIVDRIRSSYDCLGITCDDVGQHIEETDNICIDTPPTNPLAGYRPTTDVRSIALLDLDISEAAILMDTNAYDAVADLYMFGKHSIIESITGEETISLYQMAITSDRTIVPEYDSFVRFFEDNRYADTMIKRALDPNQLPEASNIQRKEIVVKTMQYLIVYMGVLQFMNSAANGCESSDALRAMEASHSWDRAAALFIGSIEGTEDGGTTHGRGLFGLAKKRCKQFDTCGDSGYSVVNEMVISLLYSGKGELSGGSCGALRRAVLEIESLLFVPLIQSCLRYAIENERHPQATDDGDLAEGYVFSRAVLPSIQDVDTDSANIIDRNLDLQFVRDPVVDGKEAVFNAFAAVYHQIGVDCVTVGKVGDINTCTGAQRPPTSRRGSNNMHLFRWILLGIFVLMTSLCCIAVVRRNRKLKHRKERNERPIFKPSNGELNHNADILTSSKDMGETSDSLMGDDELTHKIQAHEDALALA